MKRTFSVFDLSFLRKGAVGEFLEKGAADATGVPLSIKTFQATKVFIIMEPESEEEEFEEEMATDNAHVDKGDEGEAVVPTGKESVKEWSETELYETESSDSENGEEDDDGSNGTGPPNNKGMIIRWNRLSRLQRSLVYAVLIIIVTLLVLLFSSGFGTDDNKDDSSKIIQDPIKNVSLVNEPAAIVVQPVKTAVKNVINERPAFTDMSVDTDSDGKYDDIQHTFPPSSSKNWNAKMDISIFITDQQQAISHRKIIRRWNRLSRLQRSLVYAVLIIIVTLLVLLFSSGFGTDDNKDDSSKIIQDPIKNVSLVNEPAAIVVQPVKTAVENVINERPAFTGPGNARQYAVVQSFKHAWKGYKEHAWGHDNLKPVSGMAFDWFSLGLTIVDGLDTAYIMGLNEEFEEGRQWIKEHLVFTKNKDVNFFEVTIRVLGALLTNYHFTQDDMFLNKAKDLGERLMAAFSSPSGVPYSDVNLSARTAHAPEWSHYSTTAEVTTVQLEFRELSRAADNPAFEDAAGAVSEKIHQLPKKHGLVPIFINPNTGHFLPHATITLGARGDSYYEYLLKQWLQTGKTVNFFLDDYMTAIEGVREYLAKRSSPNKRLFIGELSAGSESFNPKMDHLTCFLPGTLALGHANGLPDWHMTMAEELLHTCYLTYAAHPSFLAPEITHFNMASTTDDMYTKTADAHSLLRPEFVESLWYMYQITGNTTFQDWGWHIYQSIEKHAKVPNGYTSLANVKSEKPLQRDMMETFFLSETLKYLYLLFSDDRYVIDLSKYVMNSEAHPLPIHKN